MPKMRWTIWYRAKFYWHCGFGGACTRPLWWISICYLTTRMHRTGLMLWYARRFLLQAFCRDHCGMQTEFSSDTYKFIRTLAAFMTWCAIFVHVNEVTQAVMVCVLPTAGFWIHGAVGYRLRFKFLPTMLATGRDVAGECIQTALNLIGTSISPSDTWLDVIWTCVVKRDSHSQYLI